MVQRVSTRSQPESPGHHASWGTSRRVRGCTARAGEQQQCGVGLVVPTVTNSWLQCKTAATAREFRPNPSALRGKRFAPVAKSSQSVRGSLLSDPRRSVLGTLALCKVKLGTDRGG